MILDIHRSPCPDASPHLGDGRAPGPAAKTHRMGERMHRATATVAAIAASLVAGAAHAAGTVTTTTAISSPPNLANILKGTTQTPFVITTSGSFSRPSGDFLRINGNSGSVTAVGVTLHCATFNGSGAGTCPNKTSITVTITAGTDTGWPGNVKDFAIASVTGATVSGPSSATGTTASFTLNCTGSGSKCSEGQTITFKLGMTMVFNAPPGTTGATKMPFTVSSTWN